MTDSYNQGNINLRDADPINVQTPDATDVVIILDTLTANGQVLEVDLYGGGADADITLVGTNNYAVLTGVAIFARAGGAGTIQPGPISISGAGVVPTLTFEVNDLPAPDSLTQCILRVSPGGATPYNHRFRVSKIRF
jgi:hypothetical protein